MSKNTKNNNILRMPLKNVSSKVLDYFEKFKKWNFTHTDPSIYTSYQSRASYASEWCTIYFYEFSNYLSKSPKTFRYKKDFFDFCKESNINISEVQKQWIENEKIYLFAYAICPQGKNDLIIETTRERMQSKFISMCGKNANDNDAILPYQYPTSDFWR